MTTIVMKPMPCVCGHLGVRDDDDGISEFEDDRLCRRCHRGWPFDPGLLFEHDRPSVARDGDE